MICLHLQSSIIFAVPVASNFDHLPRMFEILSRRSLGDISRTKAKVIAEVKQDATLWAQGQVLSLLEKEFLSCPRLQLWRRMGNPPYSSDLRWWGDQRWCLFQPFQNSH